MERPMSRLPLLTLLLAGCLASGEASAESESPDQLSLHGARTEVYKTVGDVKLLVHIFEPAGHQAGDQRPAILFFFGGGWKNGSPQQFEQHCRYLASRGMVAMSADYRVASRHGTKAKECVQDGKSALRWARRNASRLGIDPQRIAAGGGSAGGHVAACIGLIPGWDEPGENVDVSGVPDALVLYNPAAALAPFAGQKSAQEERARDLPERMGTDPVNLSPAHHVGPQAPPTIMFFGTDDTLLEGARYMHSRMREESNRCELKEYEGARHGFFNYGRGDNQAFADTLAETDRFLVSLGWLQGEPRVSDWLQSQPPPQRTPRQQPPG